jgi:hypothetical protein
MPAHGRLQRQPTPGILLRGTRDACHAQQKIALQPINDASAHSAWASLQGGGLTFRILFCPRHHQKTLYDCP